jgi:hypothetical protein
LLVSRAKRRAAARKSLLPSSSRHSCQCCVQGGVRIELICESWLVLSDVAFDLSSNSRTVLVAQHCAGVLLVGVKQHNWRLLCPGLTGQVGTGSTAMGHVGVVVGVMAGSSKIHLVAFLSSLVKWRLLLAMVPMSAAQKNPLSLR